MLLLELICRRSLITFLLWLVLCVILNLKHSTKTETGAFLSRCLSSAWRFLTPWQHLLNSQVVSFVLNYSPSHSSPHPLPILVLFWGNLPYLVICYLLLTGMQLCRCAMTFSKLWALSTCCQRKHSYLTNADREARIQTFHVGNQSPKSEVKGDKF